MYYYKHKENLEVLSTNDENVMADDPNYIQIDQKEYDSVIQQFQEWMDEE